MALIDFKCKVCGEKFDEIVSLSNRDNVICPKCGSKEISQVFEGKCSFGAGIKGSGGSSCGGSCGGCGGCH